MAVFRYRNFAEVGGCVASCAFSAMRILKGGGENAGTWGRWKSCGKVLTGGESSRSLHGGISCIIGRKGGKTRTAEKHPEGGGLSEFEKVSE